MHLLSALSALDVENVSLVFLGIGCRQHAQEVHDGVNYFCPCAKELNYDQLFCPEERAASQPVPIDIGVLFGFPNLNILVFHGECDEVLRPRRFFASSRVISCSEANEPAGTDVCKTRTAVCFGYRPGHAPGGFSQDINIKGWYENHSISENVPSTLAIWTREIKKRIGKTFHRHLSSRHANLSFPATLAASPSNKAAISSSVGPFVSTNRNQIQRHSTTRMAMYTK